MNKIIVFLLLTISVFPQFDFGGVGRSFNKGTAGFWLKDTTANFLLGTATGGDSALTGLIYQGGNGSLRLGGTTGLFWDNTNKRLGIGTTSPTSAFTVTGAINVLSGAMVGAVTSGTVGGLTTMRVGPIGPNNLDFITTSTSRLFVKSTGEIGIGTTAPASKFHVIGDIAYKVGGADWGITDSAIIITHTSGNPQINFYASDGDLATISINTKDSLLFSGAVGYVFDKYVSVGDSLLVAGTKVTVPDYVFDDAYNQPSIDEVESFYTKNKHLPTMLSANDIKEQGHINLVDMQMRLLETIEIQAKHISELNKRIKDLEGKIK